MEFGIDLDKVLDEFEENEGGNFNDKQKSSLLGAFSQPIESDLDLSEADFGPASFSSELLVKEPSVNDDPLESQAIETSNPPGFRYLQHNGESTSTDIAEKTSTYLLNIVPFEPGETISDVDVISPAASSHSGHILLTTVDKSSEFCQSKYISGIQSINQEDSLSTTDLSHLNHISDLDSGAREVDLTAFIPVHDLHNEDASRSDVCVPNEVTTEILALCTTDREQSDLSHSSDSTVNSNPDLAHVIVLESSEVATGGKVLESTSNDQIDLEIQEPFPFVSNTDVIMLKMTPEMSSAHEDTTSNMEPSGVDFGCHSDSFPALNKEKEQNVVKVCDEEAGMQELDESIVDCDYKEALPLESNAQRSDSAESSEIADPAVVIPESEAEAPCSENNYEACFTRECTHEVYDHVASEKDVFISDDNNDFSSDASQLVADDKMDNVALTVSDSFADELFQELEHLEILNREQSVSDCNVALVGNRISLLPGTLPATTDGLNDFEMPSAVHAYDPRSDCIGLSEVEQSTEHGFTNKPMDSQSSVVLKQNDCSIHDTFSDGVVGQVSTVTLTEKLCIETSSSIGQSVEEITDDFLGSNQMSEMPSVDASRSDNVETPIIEQSTTSLDNIGASHKHLKISPETIDADTDFGFSDDFTSCDIDVDELVRSSLGACDPEAEESARDSSCSLLTVSNGSTAKNIELENPQVSLTVEPTNEIHTAVVETGNDREILDVTGHHQELPTAEENSSAMTTDPSATLSDSQEHVWSLPPPLAGANSDEAAVLLHRTLPSRSPPMCENINIPITQLGKTPPVWIPDAEAVKCMQCESPFSFTRRRHHCRTCGKIFCSGCCNIKASISFLDHKEARVCSKCYQDLVRAQKYDERAHQTSTGSVRAPNPNNPSEYCSTLPPQSQVASLGAEAAPLSVMVPTGVLRKRGSIRNSLEPKQVMFSDGIRPGGDLTELDGVDAARSSSGRKSKAGDKTRQSAAAKTRALMQAHAAKKNANLISSTGLPPIIISSETSTELNENPSAEFVMEQILSGSSSSPATFAVNRNLTVAVQLISLDCCMNRICWSYTTRGMCNVGQDEIVVLLERSDEDKTVPHDVFSHLAALYDDASQGNAVSHLSHVVFSPGAFNGHEAGGYLFIRQTYQCLLQIAVPEAPYLFAILLQKWELPWARAFPLRLMLRLGAEYRYYPAPLVSTRNRKPVYGEIGHTIMNLLADFHNFQYTLPQIGGLVIHMEDKRTSVKLPVGRYEAIMKVVGNSDDHVMAIGASFSMVADSHLVCLQNDEGVYQTQAINIQNRPRQVTGASFIVFNGALKPSSGLRAKSSIIEDGLMVQITAESMAALKQAMRDMKDYVIACGNLTSEQPDEFVAIEWVADVHNANAGVKSPVDERSMSGVESLRVRGSTDFVATSGHAIRWTELFFISQALQNASETNEVQTPEDPADGSRLADQMAQAFCLALTPHLEALAFIRLMKIGLRVTVGVDQVGYEVGCDGNRLPEFCASDFDEKLIPIIHSAAAPTCGRPLIIELIFHILLPSTTITRSSAAASPTG